MSKKIVLLDVDEVLADFVGAVLELARDVTGRDQFRSDITQWDISTALGHTPEERAAIWDRVKERGFCSSLEPLPGAVEGVKALRRRYDVRAVTSPFKSETWAYERECWLGDVMGFEREDIVQTPGKDVIYGDVLIDDKYETVHKWQSRWPDSEGVLWLAPWNEKRGWRGSAVTGWHRLVVTVDMVLNTRGFI